MLYINKLFSWLILRIPSSPRLRRTSAAGRLRRRQGGAGGPAAGFRKAGLRLAAGWVTILLSFCLNRADAQPEATITVTVSMYSTNTPSLGLAVVSNIMAETAYLGGSVTATNGYPVSERGIYWGTNSGTVLADGTQYSHSGTFDEGDFSFFVTNLPPGKMIYFLAYAVNSQGTNFTAERAFLTRPAAPGILPPTDITANALYANWRSAESSINYLLDVAATNDFAEYLAGYSNRAAGAALTCAVTGLPARVVYYYRVRAVNATGASTNSAVMTVSQGAIGIQPASLSYTGVYGGINPAAHVFVVSNSGCWDFALTNSAGYSAGAAGWWRTTPATGSLAGGSFLAITGSVDITGLNAGTYYVTNTVISAEATNSPQYLVATLTVDKADQAITNFTPANGSVFALTNTAGLNAAGGGSTNPVMFTVISGPGVISGRTDLTFTDSGMVSVAASQSGDRNRNPAPNVTNTYIVNPSLAADIAVNDLVYLPVNATNLTAAGTVSFRLLNLGPAPMNSAEVAFDLLIGFDGEGLAVMGSSQRPFDLAVGQERLVIMTAQEKLGMVVPATMGGVKQVRVAVRHANLLVDPNLANNTTTAAGMVLVRPSGVNSPGRSPNDYDGDGKSDLFMVHADWGRLIFLLSGHRYYGVGVYETLLGAGNYQSAFGDYDGDGLLDLGVFDETTGTWRVRLSTTGAIVQAQAGAETPGYAPAVADYDGDGKSDLSLYQSSSGHWMVWLSADGYAAVNSRVGGPASHYYPMQGDYDGDGSADPAIYSETSSLLVVRLSSQDYNEVYFHMGGMGWVGLRGDFDGDGLADPGIYHEESGTWEVYLSSGGEFDAAIGGNLGGPGWLPVAADYDGDGKTDPVVYYSPLAGDVGRWQGRLSSQNYILVGCEFGGAGFNPVGE